ncbi:serine dehydratase subunit alpha family protein [Fusobacterium sp. PH5-44]|uniref:L-cysteine desulfidase family protein n=1 Tax=unclassified Fusobacterium TaxID=2648384 RepID=UPI003D23D911
MIERILKILEEEIIPSEGCTEPIALAYGASKLTSILGHIPEKIDVYLSGNMIKNIKSVTIPNSGGMAGIDAAVAMGAILGDSNKELMVISNVDQNHLHDVKEYIEASKINCKLYEGNTKLYIKLIGYYNEENASIEIKDFHTNITNIIKNDQIILDKNNVQDNKTDNKIDRSFLTLKVIYETAKSIDITLIEKIFNKVIDCNSAIAEDGLNKTYGIAIGKTIKEGIEEGFFGDDLRNNMASFASAGSDARMNGSPLPVMTTCGSGNQGMTCSLPVIKFCQMKNKSREDLIRGLYVSHLTAIHGKEKIGRLSAYCGAITAAAGVAGAISFLDGMNFETYESAVETTLATLSGIICDGAKSSCATKIASGVYGAVDSYISARKGRKFNFGDGIVGKTPEKTIEYVGILGSDGMRETDQVILNIMLNNK